MNVVDAALKTTLGGDVTLAALATGGVHRQRAPQGTATPYVVFTKMPTGREDVYSLAGRAFRRMRYLVKAVDEGNSADIANQIKDRADVLLTDQAIAVGGHSLMALRRVGDVEYPEDILGGRTVQHVGGLYDIEVDPA